MRRMRSKRAEEGEEEVATIFTSQSEDSAGSECCNVIAFVPCARPKLDEMRPQSKHQPI